MKRFVLIILALTLTLSAATDTQLERAYAKEFAFLKAQKEMLQKRFQTLKQTQDTHIQEAKKDLEQLQNLVLKKDATIEQLSNSLYKSQQDAQIKQDDTDLIEAVVLQADAAMKPYGITIVSEKGHYKNALKSIFTKAAKLITTLSSLHSEEGKFYLSDGSEIKATLIHVGNIATYGISSQASGALVPAGDDKFKLWKAPEAAQTAHALAEGKRLKELNIFIYENRSKEIDDVVEKTALDIIESGGIIGWVIVILGVIGLILAVLRMIFLAGSGASTTELAKETLLILLSKGKEETLTFLKTKKGSTARLLKATVRNLDRDREHIEDIIAESILHESDRLDRFGSTLMVIAAVSPLLGLLGTVTGMIATFDIITEFGTGDPKLLSGGISIALVTTELGLIVAIPILMLGNLLGAWAEKVKDAMEHSALHLINEYNKQR